MPIVWYYLPPSKIKGGSYRIPIGVEAHGAVADVCYRKRFGQQECVPRYEPLNRRTAYQMTWRSIFARISEGWVALSVEEKAEWTARAYAARAKPRWASGYAYYMSKKLKPYRNRSLFTVGSSAIGTDYILYGGLFTVGVSLVASGDRIS